MSPPYFFRIDEIKESEDAPVTVLVTGDAVPSMNPEMHVRVNGGISHSWWFCDSARIYQTPNGLPRNARYYQAYSMYFHDGCGFWVLADDATTQTKDETWQPLRFEHDREDGYSSYLCNSADNPALLITRKDQIWPRMLLPDIYVGTRTTADTRYGALKGELAIFLGLIAFAMQAQHLRNGLPNMFTNGAWKEFSMGHGRVHGRGVVVYVYTCPPDYPSNHPPGWTGSTDRTLALYENGQYYGGKYYH